MKKRSILLSFLLGIGFLAIEGCSDLSRAYFEISDDTPAAAGLAFCDGCTLFTGFPLEGGDGDDVEADGCPAPADGEDDFGSLADFLVTDVNCTDADGLASLATPCLNLSTNCAANDETYDVYAVKEDDPGVGDALVGTLLCCEVLASIPPGIPIPITFFAP